MLSCLRVCNVYCVENHASEVKLSHTEKCNDRVEIFKSAILSQSMQHLGNPVICKTQLKSSVKQQTESLYFFIWLYLFTTWNHKSVHKLILKLFSSHVPCYESHRWVCVCLEFQ